MTLAQLADHRPWLRAPAHAHAEWIASLRPLGQERGYAEHTLEQYRSLFRRFCEWMAGKQLTLRDVREDDLRQFLDGLASRKVGSKASNKTKRMYLAEIDRVLGHLVLCGVLKINVARALLQAYKIKDPLQPRAVALPRADFAHQLRSLVENLIMQPHERDLADSRSLRDAAMVVLMFKAGLTPKELQKLRLNDLHPMPGFGLAERVRLDVEGHRTLRNRQIELEGWVAACTVRWWQFRSAEVLRRGASAEEAPSAKTFSHPAKEHALDASIIHEATKVVCAECGSSAAGPQMLRNGFIAELIKRAVPDDEIAALAGLRVNDQVIQIRNALKKGYKRGPKPRRDTEVA